MSQKSFLSSKRCSSIFKCSWHCLINAVFVAIMLVVFHMIFCVAIGFTQTLIPVMEYLLWVILFYILLAREEFRKFRDTFRQKACLVATTKSFVEGFHALALTIIPCCSPLASCWWTGKKCERKKPAVKKAPVKKKAPAKKKAAPKKSS